MPETRRVSTRLRTERNLDKWEEPPKKKARSGSITTPSKGKRSSTVKAEPESPKIVHKYGLPLASELSKELAESLDTIASSGVLTAALQASKTRWITDSIFERYWIKPVSKKKAQKEPPISNPPKESMVKVGPCVITIQPHVFEATLYAIRDPNKQKIPKSSAAQHAPSPTHPQAFFSDHGKSNVQFHQPSTHSSYASPTASPFTAAPQSSSTASVPHGNEQNTQATLHSAAPSLQHSSQSTPANTLQQPLSLLSQPSRVPPVPQAAPARPASQSVSQLNTTTSNSVTTPDQSKSQTPASSTDPQPQAWTAKATTQLDHKAANTPQASTPTPTAPSAPKPNQDPVIQMLAQRASTDPSLKSLMKIVATGSANQEELKVFQAHIDELTQIIARQNAAAARPSPNASQTPGKAYQKAQQNKPPVTQQQVQQQHQQHLQQQHIPQPQAQPGPYHTATAQYPQTSTSSTPSSQHASQTQHYHTQQPRSGHFVPQPNGSPFHQVSYAHQPTPPAKAKPSSAARNDIIGACLEFHGISGDRFTFPKHSILEVLPGNKSLLASFIVTGKGSDANSGDYDPTKVYYQPVTMRIDVSQDKATETILRAVAPLGDCQAHMDSTMGSNARAEHVRLALNLPLELPETEENPDEETTNLPPIDVLGSWKVIKTTAAKGPILADAKPVKGWKNKVEDWSSTCRFCFEQVDRSQQRQSGDERPICTDCLRLLSASGKTHAAMSYRARPFLKDSSGPAALML